MRNRFLVVVTRLSGGATAVGVTEGAGGSSARHLKLLTSS